MSYLQGPLFVVTAIIAVVVLASIVRRLLGVRFSATRLVLAAAISWSMSAPILTAMLGPKLPDGSLADSRKPLLLVLALLVILLPSMVFLVVAEALAPSGSLPTPLEWIRGLRQRVARSRRYWRFTMILMRHGLGPYLRGRRPQANIGRSLRGALNEGGLTFIKFGQILSTRRDLLPAEVVDELSLLQHEAAFVPWPEIEAVLVAEYGAVESVFDRFDREPMAAASVAQVHSARLVSGEEVVVKVRRPGVTTVVERDLDIIRRLARTLERRTSWARSLGAVSLASGFAVALREELDFRIEARNLAAVAVTRVKGVAVPKAFTEHSSKRVLVMERFEGVPLRRALPQLAEREISSRELAERLLDYLLRQVMIDGVFHADPHPGNILLLTDGRLGMLDFGSVGRLDSSLRSSMQRLLAAVDAGDPLYLCDAVLEVMTAPEEIDEVALERDLGRFTARHLRSDSGFDVAMFTDLFRIASSYGLAVPAEVAAVFRALGTLEGTLTELARDFDIVTEARKLAGGYAAERLTPSALKHEAVTELAALVPMLRRLPRRVDRLVGALEGGKLSVNVRLFADRRDRDVVTGLVHQVLITVIAATSGLMGVLLVGRQKGPMVGKAVSLYQFLGYSFLAVASVLALRVLVVVFRRPEE
ncbi:ABC1 kinase family protein [Catenulispora rubra]|uniref:ABC1 kinase family protein n=1 Tax=Catenulispora rubra TaxID=280293 RepID=UPI00189231E5|nr:AarF/UbiB family protein [Catenulispora rubra]